MGKQTWAYAYYTSLPASVAQCEPCRNEGYCSSFGGGFKEYGRRFHRLSFPLPTLRAHDSTVREYWRRMSFRVLFSMIRALAA